MGNHEVTAQPRADPNHEVFPTDDCEGFVTSDDTTGQTGVSRTWEVRRRLYDADRSIRTIRAHFIEARRAISLHQQAGYTAAILSLSRDHETLQNGRRPYTGFKPDRRRSSLSARVKSG
jgi:hypothetical protein